MKFYLNLIFLVVAAVSSNVFAVRLDMKPGLWETTMKMDPEEFKKMQKEQLGGMGDSMQKMMDEAKAKMTPEQLKQFESMMGEKPANPSKPSKSLEMPASAQENIKQLGSFLETGVMTTKNCITQKDIDDAIFSKDDMEENCVTKSTQVSPSNIKTVVDCKGENASHTEADVSLLNSKSYSGKFVSTTTINNKSMVVHGVNTGKWLAADCGEYAEDQRGKFGSDSSNDETEYTEEATKVMPKKK